MATSVNAGNGTEILNGPIDNSGFQPYSFQKIPNNLLISVRDGSEFYIATELDSGQYFTVHQGQTLTWDCNFGKAENVIYIKGSTSTVAEVIVTY